MNAVLERQPIVLTQVELIAITGYRQASRQLAELHNRGFHRATLGRDGVVLERAHYEAASTAWMRGVKRAGVPPTMMRDIRAKSATDKEESHGMGAASALLDHTTEAQTSDYVRRKKARKTGAVR